MARTIDVVSLYPKDMNIYGDSGNVLTIRRRLELYGYEPVVHQYNQATTGPTRWTLFWERRPRHRPEENHRRLLPLRRPVAFALPQTVRRC